MLTGRGLVFVGGDARMLEVIAQVIDSDASGILIGFEKLNRNFTDTVHSPVTEEVFSHADALVLPVAGMDDDGIVESNFSDTPIHLEDYHFAAMRPGTFVFTGIARPLLQERCLKHSLRLVKLMELDEVAILNSIPTAEGAIAIAMEKTDITLHGSQTVVLGFGRCGHTLARTLSALGAKVSVCARKAEHLARIREMGLEAVPMYELQAAVSKANIVFNTVPSLILTAGVLKMMQKECVIIDIASKPGGTDFRYAERRGMTALLAPSLPGVVAPKTAGRIIAETLCRILAHGTQNSNEQ